jgi:hypothetical protein
MSERGKLVFIVIVIFTIFLISSQDSSAKFNFPEFINKITGLAGSETFNVSISTSNNAPSIGNITLDQADNIQITEDGNTTVQFSFVVTDSEGNDNLNNNAATANITRGNGNENPRYNNTLINPGDGGCVNTNDIGTNGRNFTCTIRIVFYDEAGTWNISVFINDSNGNSAINDTFTFTIQETTSITLVQNSLSFPIVAPNNNNISSSTNITIRNIANDDLSGDSTREFINISATPLTPGGAGTTFIPVGNFTLAQANISGTEFIDVCDTSQMINVTILANDTATNAYDNSSVTINSSIILAEPYNNYQVYSTCLLHAPNDLVAGTYSTANSGAWTLTVW